MGVHGLWELLAPVGRRVSVETLAGKKVAIDASIWMVQFMKAMRDERGEMVRNAHLLGFFRRICKLLFLRTKPVFVFDGGTPALKRRTVIARRRQRENAQAKIRKTAEKLLLNHLKAMRLKELANDLESQRKKNDAKGKKVITDQIELEGNSSEGNNTVPFGFNQEALDEMLAASLAAEEDGSFTGNASTSGVEIFPEEEDDDEDEDEDEEMVLPAMNGKVDPAVLAALPPSMQLDLLVQMRERLMAENRQKYQKVKKVPAKFSELQIQAYLKTVAFRREIDEVQKAAVGKGVGGVQTSRIASESKREFIFSSSFTGDKEVLTSAGVERHSERLDKAPSEPPPSEPMDRIASTKKSDAETGPMADDPGRIFDEDIETYLDDRGHVRVSRVRAMGIRMTRDLQRNLDLMKEIEQDIVHTNEIPNSESVLDNNADGVSRSFPDKFQVKETSHRPSDGSVHLNDRNDQSTSRSSNLMEISFEDNADNKYLDGDDNLFARLVAGDPVMTYPGDTSPSKRRSFDSDSDIEWEEGVIEEKGDCSIHAIQKGSRLSLAEGGSKDESGVQWEDGDSYVTKYALSSPAESRETASKGILEEEANFQEAIRRSMEDLRGQKSSDASFKDEKLKGVREMVHEIGSAGSVENDKNELDLALENVVQLDKSSEFLNGVERLDGEARMNVLHADGSPGLQLPTSMAVNDDSMQKLLDNPFERYPNYHDELFRQHTSELGNLRGQNGCEKSTSPVEEKGDHLTAEKLKSNTGSQVSTCATISGASSQVSDMVFGGTPHVILAGAQPNVFDAAEQHHGTETTEPGEPFVKESTINHEVAQESSKENNRDNIPEQIWDEMEELTSKDDKEQPIEVTESTLEEEMLNLTNERIDLADEQRKLERNAESVSSEMFAECQELLQMFGLPYIIAPMEAEAQCAYMELTNLVDGVVTDDSDVFLFGAQSVYKNIFDDRKYVETYFMKDIENELGLTREKLIRMALLLGSDYTEGVSGIGIVNAIEVVNAFPEEDGLCKFREWIESPDPTILGKFDVQTGSSSKKRGSKVSDNDADCSNSNIEGLSASDEPMDYIQNTKQIFMDKHRNVSKNWHIPSSFPNEAVISEYVSPQVDKSTEPFSWGKPDLFVLRKLCWEKFGWGMQKADDLLLPVLKEYSKHETQLRLEAFYTFNERFAKIRSKRIKKAVKGITGNTSSEVMDDLVQEGSKSRKKRRVSPSENKDEKSAKSSSGTEDCVTRDERNSTQTSTAKSSRKRKHEKPEQNTSQGLSARGRGRGSKRGRAVGRGGRKKTSGPAYAETSSDDGSNSDNEQMMQDEKLEEPHEVRKSTRTRKAVKYTLDDVEIDEPGKPGQDEENCSDEEAVQEEPSEDHDLVGDTSAALPGEKNEHKAGDPSVENSRGDYIEIGGGFCMDEAETELGTGQQSIDQNGDHSFEAEMSKEYLNLGGGFCLDKDGTNENADKCAVEPAKKSVSDDVGDESADRTRADALDIKQTTDHLTPRTSDDNISTLAMSPPRSIGKDDSGTVPVNSLSAMPYLRRKRRKN